MLEHRFLDLFGECIKLESILCVFCASELVSALRPGHLQSVNKFTDRHHFLNFTIYANNREGLFCFQVFEDNRLIFLCEVIKLV